VSRPPARPSERRARGGAAEDRAAAFLEARGFRVLDRNYLTRRGEVDLVAEQDEVLAFVEVRSRSGAAFGSPAETVSLAKRRRVIAAAIDWATRAGVLESRAIRFDVISVIDRADGEPEIEWIPAAFDATGTPI